MRGPRADPRGGSALGEGRARPHGGRRFLERPSEACEGEAQGAFRASWQARRRGAGLEVAPKGAPRAPRARFLNAAPFARLALPWPDSSSERGERSERRGGVLVTVE